MGWLARQYGLTCDNVVSCELVSAAGAVVRASATENPDLGRRLLPALQPPGIPESESVVAMSYVDLQRMEDTVRGHAVRRYWKGHYLYSLPDGAADALLMRGTVDGRGD